MRSLTIGDSSYRHAFTVSMAGSGDLRAGTEDLVPASSGQARNLDGGVDQPW